MTILFEMEKTLRIIIKILFLTVIAVLIAMTCSCGSKKKTVNKSESKTEIITENKEKTKEKTEAEKTVSELESVKTTGKDHEDFFSGEVADPSKPARKIEEEKDGVKTTTYENFKNVDHGKRNSESETHKKTETEITEKEISQKETTKESKAKEKGSEKKAETDIKRDQGFKLPWWVWVIGIAYLALSIWRKSLTPWR